MGFHPDMVRVVLPGCLQTFTLQPDLREALCPWQPARLHLRPGLQSELEHVHIPVNLMSLAFGGAFNQSMEKVGLPGSLRRVTFGSAFNQSLQEVVF